MAGLISIFVLTAIAIRLREVRLFEHFLSYLETVVRDSERVSSKGRPELLFQEDDNLVGFHVNAVEKPLKPPSYALTRKPESPLYSIAVVTGLPRGAYRRIGSTDQHCTDEDVALFYQLRSHHTYDETAIEDIDPERDFDAAAIRGYRNARAEMSPDAPELGWTDAELLHALCATSRKEERNVSG